MRRAGAIAQIVWLELIRKKDVYVLLILLGALLATLVSLDIFGLGGQDIFVKDIGLLIVWLFGWILAIGIASRALPQEEQKGTIFPLLAKPITRLELLLGKWLGCWSATAVAVAAFHLLVAGIVTLQGGHLDPAATLQGFLLQSSALGLVCAFALLFSTRMNADASAALTGVTTLASALIVPLVPAFMLRATGFSGAVFMAFYNLLPHFEFFDMRKRVVYDYGPVDAMTFAGVLLYGAAYTALLLIGAWLVYRKKRFSRGNLG